LHGLLRDTLDFLSTASFSNDDEDAMEEDFEEGECITDTGHDTDMSVASNVSAKKSKDKKLLTLPSFTKKSLDELANGEFDEQNTELNFKEILTYDYYVDDQHLWLNNKQRVNLKEVVVRIEETPFNVETVLRIVEMAANSLPYNAYSKDLLKNYPEVQPVEEENYEKLSVMYQKGELKVSPVQIQSVELMLKNYLEAYKRLACLKTDEPPLFQAVSRSFQPLALKYYKSVYSCGLACQKNWSDLSSLVAQEYVDCWLISNFDYPSLVQPFLDLERNEAGGIGAKKNKLKSIYDNLLDGLVDQAQAMPPAIKLHSFVKGTMFDLEAISSQDI